MAIIWVSLIDSWCEYVDACCSLRGSMESFQEKFTFQGQLWNLLSIATQVGHWGLSSSQGNTGFQRQPHQVAVRGWTRSPALSGAIKAMEGISETSPSPCPKHGGRQKLWLQLLWAFGDRINNLTLSQSRGATMKWGRRVQNLSPPRALKCPKAVLPGAC